MRESVRCVRFTQQSYVCTNYDVHYKIIISTSVVSVDNSCVVLFTLNVIIERLESVAAPAALR